MDCNHLPPSSNFDPPTVTVWGDGSPTREFLYVEDAAEAILLVTERYDKGEPVNLGSGNEISIKELVELIWKKTGFTGEIVWDTSKPNGQPGRKLDVSRAEREFGFRARVPFEEGLKKTTDWYIRNRMEKEQSTIDDPKTIKSEKMEKIYNY